MSKFELNQAAIGKLANDATAAVRDAANEVAQTHKGRSPDEVRRALKAAVARRGLTFEPAPDDEIVDQIASGQDVQFT